MINIKTSSFTIPLRSSFKHNTAERNTTDTVLLFAEQNGVKGVGESCPRTYVTGESVDSALAWIASKQSELTALTDFNSFKEWQSVNKKEIDKNTAAFCAIEVALLDLFSKQKGVTVETFLGIPEITGPFQYTAVVSDEQGEKLTKILGQYIQLGFTDFKFKLSGDQKLDREKFATLDAIAGEKKTKLRVRIDANNIWPGRADDAIAYIAALERKFFGIEEPLGPHDLNGLSKLSVALNTPVILDESLITPEDMEAAVKMPGKWMPNIRVSKVGGVQRALEIARIATANNCKIIMGAQVGETSILSRAALSVVQAYKSNVEAQEGAYGTILLEKEIVEPEVRFGAAGILNWQSQGKGFGLNLIDANVGA